MRLNINLASRPYEDARRFYIQWLPLLIVLVAIAATLCTYAYRRMNDSRQVEKQLAEKRQQISQLDREQSEAEAFLNRPENSGTRDEARFLNETFARKSFSWTNVLADLEKIMPPRVQVVSIKPAYTDGQLQFDLSITTDKRDDAIELVRRMESSPRFRQPEMVSEKAKADTTKDNKITVQIVSGYVPSVRKGTT